MQRIEFVGLSPELQQRVQTRLTVREGDTLSRADWERLRASVKEIDEHLVVFMQYNGNYEPQRLPVVLRVALAGAGEAQPQPTAVGSSRPVTVGGKVMEPRIVQRVPPVYPANAKTAGVQGAVELSITIGTDGKVQNAAILAGPPLLTKAALDAVSQWVYQPFLLNGQPTAVNSTVTVNFVLQ